MSLGSGASLTFDNRKALAHLRVEAARFPKRLKRAVRVCTERVLTKIKRQYVPVRKGTLRRSGRVVEPQDLPSKTIGFAIQFGDAASPYAAAVHEFPDAHVPPSWEGVDVQFNPSGTGPKYIERALKEEAPVFASKVMMELQKDK